MRVVLNINAARGTTLDRRVVDEQGRDPDGKFASGGSGSSGGGSSKSDAHHQMEKAIHADLAKREGHGLSKEKVEAIAADFVGKKSVDIMKLADKHGISIGMAKALNQVRKDHVAQSSGSTGGLTQAQRVGRYLRENK